MSKFPSDNEIVELAKKVVGFSSMPYLSIEKAFSDSRALYIGRVYAHSYLEPRGGHDFENDFKKPVKFVLASICHRDINVIRASLGASLKAMLEEDREITMPAFPSEKNNGMTLKQYAAIHLKVPNSGTDWLDDMIKATSSCHFINRKEI